MDVCYSGALGVDYRPGEIWLVGHLTIKMWVREKKVQPDGIQEKLVRLDDKMCETQP